MARLTYGGSPADVFTKVVSDPTSADATHTDLQILANVSLTAWTAFSGGTQLTSLQDMSNAATTVVLTDSRGRVRFQGPDGYTAAIFLEDPDGYRWRVDPSDLATRSIEYANVYAMDPWDGTGTQPARGVNLPSYFKVFWAQPTAPPAGTSYGHPGDRWQVTG